MKYCKKCNTSKPLEDFYKHNGTKDGRHSVCSDCAKAAKKVRYDADPEKYLSRNRAHAATPEAQRKRKERILELRKIALDAYGNCCACCGETEDAFLTFDHIGGWGAEHRRTIGEGYAKLEYWLHKHKYPDTIQLLCWNCNCAIGIRGYCPHQRGK